MCGEHDKEGRESCGEGDSGIFKGETMRNARVFTPTKQQCARTGSERQHTRASPDVQKSKRYSWKNATYFRMSEIQHN